MSVFDLDERGQKVALTAGEGVRADQMAPGFLDGLGYGAGMGVMRGAANLARNASLLGGGTVATVLDQIDNGGHTSYRDRYFKWHDETFQSAADFWTPTASDVGTMGRILGGLGEVVAPLALGPVGAPAMVGSMTATPAIDLARQGVRAEDAIPVGLAQGAAAAVGFRIPFVGNTLTQRMAAGAAGNLATNVPAQIASQGVLRSGGYEAAIIDQYDPWDAEGRMVDVLAGGVFGAVAHAAMVSAKNAKHYQSDSAPRVPVDQAEAALHSRGMDATLDQLIAGEPVNVPDEVARQFAGTVLRPNQSVADAIMESVGPELQALHDVDAATLRHDAAETAPDVATDGAVIRLGQALEIPWIREELALMRNETGWAQVGGKIIREIRDDGLQAEVVARTTWIPAAEWWPGRPKGLTEAQVKSAIDKALAGEKLTKRESMMVEYMAQVADERYIQQPFMPESADYEAAGVARDTSPNEAAMVARAAQLDESRVERLAIQAGEDHAAFMRGIKELLDEQGAKPAQTRQGDQPATRQVSAIDASLPELTRARAILDASPDLVIRMDDGTDVRASDLISSLEAEHAQTANDANAFAAAVECMLRTAA